MKKFALPFRGGIESFVPENLPIAFKETPEKGLSLLDNTLYKYADKIYDVFFPSPFTRACIPTSPFDIELLRGIVQLCKYHNVKAEMLLNASCMEELDFDVIEFCEKEGVDSVAVANYYLLEKVYRQKKAHNSSVLVMASVVMFIAQRQTYEYIKHMIDGLVIAVDAIPDHTFVEDLINDGKIVKAVVNDGCIYQCPYKKIHLALDGHKSDGSEKYIGYGRGEKLRGGCLCHLHYNQEIFDKMPVLYPEDSYFEGVIWKINGRHLQEDIYKYITDCYFNETNGDRSKKALLGVRGWYRDSSLHP